MNGIAAFAITVAFGPVAFYLFSSRAPERLGRFPLSTIDGIGDILLLPLFNALAAHYGILALLGSPVRLVIALSVAYIATRIYTIYNKDFQTVDNWSRPKRHHYSAGGWYHAVFMFVEIFVVVITMLFFYTVILLWVILACYALLVLYEYLRVGKLEKMP